MIERYYKQLDKKYAPKLLRDHAHAFYFNSDKPMSGESAGLRLDLYAPSGSILTDVATVVEHTINNGYSWRWYTEHLQLSGSSLSKLEYYLALVDTYGGNIKTAADASQQVSIAALDTACVDVKLSHDGTKMFVLGNTNDSIYQYTLTTPFDVSTGSYDSVSLDVSGYDNAPAGFRFKPDGTKLYLVGDQNNSLYEVILKEAWDVSDSSAGNTYVIGKEEPTAVDFSPDGLLAVISDLDVGQARIREYRMTTAWDISTMYPTGIELDTGNDVNGLKFIMGGSRLLVQESSEIGEIFLGVPYHVETVGDATKINSYSNAKTEFFDLSSDGQTLVCVTSNIVYGHSLSAGISEGYDVTSKLAGGSFLASARGLQYSNLGNKFFYATGNDIYQYTSATPWALTSIASDSLSIDTSTTFDGYTENNILSIKFSKDGKKLFIIGDDHHIIWQWNCLRPFNLLGAYYSKVKFAPSGGTGDARGMEFSEDGKTMLVHWNTEILEFKLKSPYDIASAKATGTSITIASNVINDVVWINHGQTLLVVDDTDNQIEIYACSTPYDISTATLSASESVSAQSTSPYCVAVNYDGTKLYLGGSNIYEYTLDLETAVIPVLGVSNAIQIVEDLEDQIFLEYGNSEDIFNFGYFDTQIKNTIVLDAAVTEENYEVEKSQYKEITTGKTRDYGSSGEEILTLETFWFDEPANRMMSTMLHHDYIRINDMNYSIKDAFESENNKFNPLSKGTLKLISEEYSELAKHS